jgi:hypothetical protein
MKKIAATIIMVVLGITLYAQDTLQTTPYNALPAATIESWQTQLEIKDSTWIDAFIKAFGYWNIDSLGSVVIPASQVTDLADSIALNSTVSANTGKDTTGIFHSNRAILDATTASFTTTLSGNISTNNSKVTFPGFTNLSTDYSFTDNSSEWDAAYDSIPELRADINSKLDTTDVEVISVYSKSEVDSVAIAKADSLDNLLELGGGSGITGADSTVFDTISHVMVVWFNQSQYIFAPSDSVIYSPYGEELITNGTFDSDLTGWTQTGSSWSWNSGKALHAQTSGDALKSTPSVTTGTTYRVEYTVSGMSEGTIKFVVGSQDGTTRSADGTYIENITCAGFNDYIEISPSWDFNGSVDDVSVKEVL